MKASERPGRAVRLCALALLGLALLVVAGAAQATPGGTPVAWGCREGDDYGQCAVSDLSDVTAIAGGYSHSLVLRADGTVVARGCGFFDYGQCSVPADLSGVTAVAAGPFDSLALKSDGTVVGWGCGVGNNFFQCDAPEGLSGVTAIAGGAFHSLALKSDGTVVAWGCGGTEYGQCTVPQGLSGVTAISANVVSSLALKTDGTVVAWGCEVLDYGQCDVPSGLSDVVAIDAGFYDSLALKRDGTVVAWGCAEGGNECDVPEGLSGVTAIAAGSSHSLAIVGPANQPPDCSGVTAAPATLRRTADTFAPIALAGATDPDGDTLRYHVDGVTQDEPVTGLGDDTFPDGALTAAGAGSNQVLVRAEANSHFDGRVYRIAYTVSDGNGASCSGTAKVSVPRKKGTTAVDGGDTASWDSFTGAPAPAERAPSASERE